MAQKNHQNCCNTQPRHAHRNENKSEILLNITMEGAKARGVTEERFQFDSYRLVKSISSKPLWNLSWTL